MHDVTQENEKMKSVFLDKRTPFAWTDKKVPLDMLEQLYDMVKFGPTSANISPLRLVFIVSQEHKQRLLPAMQEGNKDKIAMAPVVTLLAMDTKFDEYAPVLFPHVDIRPWFADEKVRMENAFRNSSMQGGYFIIAARILGLGCHPMSGFDPEMLNKEFFPDGRFHINFICNIGYPKEEHPYPRLPRLSFKDAVTVL